MTTTTGLNFLGIPVEGDIHYADQEAKQKPIEELEPLLRAVIDDPTIESLGWSQYTPYFNDGDTCTFGVGDVWIRTTDELNPEEHDVEDDDTYTFYYGHPQLGERKFSYEGTWPDRHRVDGQYTGPDEARYERCRAFVDAMDSGAYNRVLLAAFGDHAEVTVRRTGITVDFYSHD